MASIGAADIIDVDYSTRESASVAARRAAEQQVKETPQFAAAEAAVVNPRVERLLAALLRFVKSGGPTVKTTQGLTTFGAGLEDEEVQYLHAIVRRALQGHGGSRSGSPESPASPVGRNRNVAVAGYRHPMTGALPVPVAPSPGRRLRSPCPAVPTAAAPADLARRHLLIVVDGLRPDYVTPDVMRRP